jgi:hypothetical protein
MRDSLPFLLRLDLGPHIDARAIRRAYARGLKLIDQERDPAAFQELREAYEAALHWIASQEVPSPPAQTAAPLAEPVASPAAPLPPLELDDPQRVAAEAFEQFANAARQLIAERKVHDSEPWQELLQQILASEPLLNLMARTWFEAHIVNLLASGWQAGHDMLFVAAVLVFGWEGDRQGVLRFGRAGACIDRAIEERFIFKRLSGDSMALYVDVIARLRQPGKAKAQRIKLDLQHLDVLLARFPTWLHVITDVGQAVRWRDAAKAATQPSGKEAAIAPMTAPMSEPALGMPARSARIFFVLAILCVLGIYAYQRYQDHWEHERRARYLASLPVEKPVTRSQIEEIMANIRYQRSATAGKGDFLAVYDIYLDANGNVTHTVLTRPSGDPIFDLAVDSAIRASKVFPPGTRRKFNLGYSNVIKRDEAPLPNQKH